MPPPWNPLNFPTTISPQPPWGRSNFQEKYSSRGWNVGYRERDSRMDHQWKNYTIQLPPTKSNEICKIIRFILKQFFSLNKLKKTVRNPQHASFGMPVGLGLFGPIQKEMTTITPLIILKSSIKTFFSDWHSIFKQLATQPTSDLQLVQELPSCVGYSDACKLGVVGLWVSGMKKLTPFMWKI